MTDPTELLRRWQRMYNAMDSKHEDKWPKDDDFQKLRQDTHAALAARPVTPAPESPIAWWNGFRREDLRDESVGPSFAEKENSSHDIPVFAGCNPHSNEARLSRAARIVAGQAGEDSAKFIDWLCDGGFVQMALSHFGRPASTPEALSDEQIDAAIRMVYGPPIILEPSALMELREFARAIAALAAPSTPASAATAELLFSFGGFLTSSERQWVFSSHDDAAPMVEAIRIFAEREGINLAAPSTPPPETLLDGFDSVTPSAPSTPAAADHIADAGNMVPPPEAA